MTDDTQRPSRNGTKYTIEYSTSAEIDMDALKNSMFQVVTLRNKKLHVELVNNKLIIKQL